MKPLTSKQQAILDYAEANKKNIVQLPPIRTMAKHFGVSLGTMQSHIQALKRKRVWPN